MPDGGAALRAITADRHRGHPMETRGYRSPRKERRVEKGRCAHQATALWYSSCEQSRCLCQWREISEYETATCADCSSVQSTDRIGSFRRQRIDATSRIPLDRFESQTAWNKADWTTSRWAAWSHFEVSETPCRSGDRQSGSRSYHYQRARGHGELSIPTRRTRRADEPNNGMPEWVASTLSSIAKHMLESSTFDREAVAQSLLGLMVPAPPPAPPDAQQNGVSNNIIDMCDVASRGNKHEGGADWPQNTNKVRLTTKTMIEETPQLEDIRTRRRSGMSDS